MKSYYISFVRNALTAENLEGRYIGHTDVPLSPEGIEQLEALKNELPYRKVDAVFSSPLKRCMNTAKILYPDCNPIAIPDLIEYNFGEFEGKTAEELKEHPVFSRWLAGEADVEPPFGESNKSFQKRVCVAFQKIVDGLLKTGTTRSAIVTHGGVIMTLLAAFGLPQAQMHEWLTPNCCGYTVRITPSIWMREPKMEVIALEPEDPGEAESIDNMMDMSLFDLDAEEYDFH